MNKSTPEIALKRLLAFCFSSLLLIGTIGLINNISDISHYLFEEFGIIPISAISSVAYILLGIAMLIFSQGNKRPRLILLGKAITFIVMFLSLVVCTAFVANQDYDFQRALLGWLIDEEHLQISRIAPLGAFGMLIGTIGLHIRLIPEINRYRSATYLIGTFGILVFTIGSMCLLGYAYGTAELYGGSNRPVSIASSVGLVFLGLGVLAGMNPMDWPLKIVFGQENRYILIRYLVPLTAILILVISWVIAVIIPRYQDVLLLVTIFDILAVFFVSLLVSQLSGILDKRLSGLQRERDKALEELKVANEKLQMLGSLTRHDILNQISLSRMEAELAKRYDCDPKVVKGLDNIILINKTIEGLLRFQKEYQQIGEKKERWLDLEKVISGVVSQLDFGKVKFEMHIEPISVFADPMIEKALYNIIENSIRHGGTVSKIVIRDEIREDGSLILAIEDNGIGVEDAEKERIFLKDVGKNTGLGLFLTREILRHSGMTVKETGRFGKGARFEISVPPERYKIIQAS